jgi:anti-anti-sigma factor
MAPPPPPIPVPAGTLRVSQLDGTTVVELHGEHDIATAPELRRLLLKTMTAATVVVDLAECRFLDGSIIGVLVGAHSRLARHGRRLVTTNASGQPQRTLAILQDSLNFDVHPAGLAAAAQQTA